MLNVHAVSDLTKITPSTTPSPERAPWALVIEGELLSRRYQANAEIVHADEANNV